MHAAAPRALGGLYMWYLNMNAVIAIIGMVLVLALTRRWPGNKRYLLLAFNLCFLFVF